MSSSWNEPFDKRELLSSISIPFVDFGKYDYFPFLLCC